MLPRDLLATKTQDTQNRPWSHLVLETKGQNPQGREALPELTPLVGDSYPSPALVQTTDAVFNFLAATFFSK